MKRIQQGPRKMIRMDREANGTLNPIVIRMGREEVFASVVDILGPSRIVYCPPASEQRCCWIETMSELQFETAKKDP